MRNHFYQKTWFKNTILISIPSLISVIGITVSIITNQSIKIGLILFSIFLMIILTIAIVYFSNQEDKICKDLESEKEANRTLTAILAHMENEYKTATYTISTFSELAEKWSATINSFANNVLINGFISDKAWDKVKMVDSICLCCRDMIKQYCNNFDNSKISVSFVTYKKDDKGEEWVKMSSHSNPESTRPNACKDEEKLSECIYHYADLIKEELSDIEIAINNEEIKRIFKMASTRTDLNKYTQYIAIPLYCKSRKLLGIFQIVTKYGYIIENDRLEMEKFVTDSVIPYSNLIVLIDKIYKGLYVNPTKINKEV